MKTQVLTPMLAIGLLISSACGGSQSKDRGSTPGQTHSTSTAKRGNGDAEPGVDIDAPLGGDPVSDPDPGETSTPAAPVTFVMKNSGDENLYINMDKGWQAVIFAYSGTPPNAKPMVMFPTHCTASCDSAPEDICPVCEAPERVKEIKAAENHDEVVPGDTREIAWDLKAFKSKRTRGKNGKRNVRCNCYQMVEPEPETYTIKACALRKTQSAKTRSKYQCVESTLTLPVTEPVKVELDFGN